MESLKGIWSQIRGYYYLPSKQRCLGSTILTTAENKGLKSGHSAGSMVSIVASCKSL